DGVEGPRAVNERLVADLYARRMSDPLRELAALRRPDAAALPRWNQLLGSRPLRQFLQAPAGSVTGHRRDGHCDAPQLVGIADGVDRRHSIVAHFECDRLRAAMSLDQHEARHAVDR